MRSGTAKKDHKQVPVMEKLGIKYMKTLNDKTFSNRFDNRTYILDQAERDKINKIERQAIVNAVSAGIISTLVSGLAGFLADPLMDVPGSLFSDANIIYWSVVLGVTIVASLIEIMYVYYDVMQKSFALASAAHLRLFPGGEDKKEIVASIVRAALELPNKKDSDLAIDPKRESSKVLILLGSVLYKLKISLSSFLFRAFIKRMMGRAISRAWLNFMAIPVCAFWNGMVCWLVMREVKIRVLGPSAAMEVVNKINKTDEKLSSEARLAILMSIGSCIVKTADLHPNLEIMYRSVLEHIKEFEDKTTDDPILFLEQLKKLNNAEKKIVLEVLIYSSIVDGKITVKEKELLEKAYHICGTGFDFEKVKSFLKNFRAGALSQFTVPVLTA
ncbi:MAG: hypothetical protein U0W24_21245 [Bacteroidales bacterium]